VTEERLASPLAYKKRGQRQEHPLWWAVAHLFNHQTHHRGQAHTLLTIAGGRPAAPSLDLVLFQRMTGIGLG
jgi:uncharacterized damage-inducible protein DinB